MEKSQIILNEKVIKDGINARNPWDPMWQKDWNNIFNEQVNNAIFYANYEIDDVDINAREILKEIKEMQPKISVGNDYEIRFLAYCGALDVLLKSDMKKRPFSTSHKTDPYWICLGKLMREWAKVRKSYILEQIKYFLNFGKPKEELVQYVELLEEIYVSPKIVKLNRDDKLYLLYLYRCKGNLKIPMEQYSKLQEIINKISIFYNKSTELIDRTKIEYDDYSHLPEGVLLRYKYMFEDEALFMAILRDCFLPKTNHFSNKVNELKSVKNEILFRLGLNLDALPDKSQDDKQHQKIKGYIPKMDDKITIDSLLKKK